MKQTSLPCITLAVLLLSPVIAGLPLHADTTIVYDSLSLTPADPAPSPVDLDGTKPTDRGGTDVPNTAWSNAQDEFTVSETGTQAAGGSIPVAELNVGTLDANRTYTLTVHLNFSIAANNDDAEFGFDDNNIDYINSPTGPNQDYNDTGSASLYYETDGGSSQGATIAPTGDNLLQLVLTTGTDYTVTASINGQPVGSTFTYTGAAGANPNPAIDGIFIGAQGDDGAIYTDIQLTENTVPEASTWALLGVGLASLGMILRFRRRNS